MNRSMMQVYVKNSHEAMKLYETAFGTTGQIYGTFENGGIEHAEINVCGQTISLMENADEVAVGNNMQFIFDMGKGREDFVQNAYDVLMLDAIKCNVPLGKCEYAALMFSLVDKFGVNWMIMC
ncbi:MAG: VOC family protein [Oscillospiraceae bacterium]|nr:VOC family protein [Oscillospiraceae bacterium]